MSDAILWHPPPQVTYMSVLCAWIENAIGSPYDFQSIHYLQILQAYSDSTYPNPSSQDVLGCLFYYEDEIAMGNTYTGCTFPVVP